MEPIRNYWEGKALRCKTITLRTNKDSGSYELPDKQILHKNAIVRGISSRRATATAQTRNGAALANDAVVDAAFLQLRDMTTRDYLRDMPFSYLFRRDSDNFMLCLPGITLDIANCKVFTKNTAAQVEDEEIEMTFWYELPEDR